MTAAQFDFDRLLHPVRTEVFFADYWERKPLLLQRQDTEYFRSLLSADDLSDILTHRGLRYPAIRLAKGGAFFPAEAYTRDIRYGDEVFTGVPDLERIFTEYCAGATVTLPALHLTWPRLGSLCALIESQLDHSVHTNAYLTAPRTPGFTPHYDTHEVFILQISGIKHWRVYPPAIRLPHRGQPCEPHYAPSAPPLLEFDLAAGDLLYLPRGFVHATTTATDSSAHVTIGVTVYTGVELASELLQNLVHLPQLRRALPIGFASRPQMRAQLKGMLVELAQHLQEGMNADALIDAFTRRVVNSRPRTTAPFAAAGSAIGPNTRLRFESAERHPILEEAGVTILHLEGRRVRLPAGIKPLLEAMRAAPSFSPASLPGSVSLDGRVSLVRYLHGLGVLRALAE